VSQTYNWEGLSINSLVQIHQALVQQYDDSKPGYARDITKRLIQTVNSLGTRYDEDLTDTFATGHIEINKRETVRNEEN
jgi:hypothetical protein